MLSNHISTPYLMYVEMREFSFLVSCCLIWHDWFNNGYCRRRHFFFLLSPVSHLLRFFSSSSSDHIIAFDFLTFFYFSISFSHNYFDIWQNEKYPLKKKNKQTHRHNNTAHIGLFLKLVIFVQILYKTHFKPPTN